MITLNLIEIIEKQENGIATKNIIYSVNYKKEFKNMLALKKYRIRVYNVAKERYKKNLMIVFNYTEIV